jgi:hypothetical protein
MHLKETRKSERLKGWVAPFPARLRNDTHLGTVSISLLAVIGTDT